MGVIRGQTYEIYPYEVIKDVIPRRGELLITADPSASVGAKLLVSMLIGDGVSTAAQLRGNVPVNTSQLEQNVLVLSDSFAEHISKLDAHNATAAPEENRIVLFGANKGVKSGAAPVDDDDVVRKLELDSERNRAEEAENALEAAVRQLAEQESSIPNGLSTLEAALAAEADRARQAEAGLNLEIHRETGRAKIAEEGLEAATTAEQSRAQQAEDALARSVAAERERAEAAEAGLEAALDTEITQEQIRTDAAIEAAVRAEQDRAEQAETSLGVLISQERTRAEGVEHSLVDATTAEQSRAQQAEDVLARSVAAERERAEAAEAGLEAALDTEITQEQIRTDAAIEAAVRAEQDRAEQAETSLGVLISQERTRAEGVEHSLVDAITAEQSRAQQAEDALARSVAAERERAEAAEALKAPLDSPAFTGAPTAPTPDGTTLAQLVNVEFVKAVSDYIQQQLDAAAMNSFTTLEGEYYRTITGMYYIQNDEVLPRMIDAVEEQIRETVFISLDAIPYMTQNGAKYLQNDGGVQSTTARKIHRLRSQIDAVDPVGFVTLDGVQYTSKTGMPYIQNDEVIPQQLKELKNRMDAVDPVSFITSQGVFYKSLNGKQYILQKE